MSFRSVSLLRTSSFKTINNRCFSAAVPDIKDEINDTEGRKPPTPAGPLKRPEGMVSKTYNRSTYPYTPVQNMVHKEFLNEGDINGMGARLTDYYKMGDMVRQLKTPLERIEFVSPYERPWKRYERKWHRVFHPALGSPRKAWNINAVPKYFNSLDFYKYITKTRLITTPKSFDNYYTGLVPPTQNFEKRVNESLLSFFNGNEPTDEKSVTEFLRTTLNDAELSIAHNNDSLRKYRASFNERCESFWIRGGFCHMYDQKKIWDDIGEVYKGRRLGPRFIGDDRRRLGEVAFVMRDRIAAQLRSKTKLPVVASFNQAEFIEAPVFEDTNLEEDVIFSPLIYNMSPDVEPLWQCPGYEPDSEEPFKFGRLGVKNVFELKSYFKSWKIPSDSEEYVQTLKDSYASTAISSLFNWLNGQAHCLGHTQYNDIEEPLVSQIILSDGKTFCFALGQLNTIAINVEMDGFLNRRSNFCLVDGPHNLYDEYDSETQHYKHFNESGELVDGLNPHVLSRYLQMIMIGREA
uniref:Uncharacterized protein n=1 Tax=Panagrolaimus superbus TaxID=310955 RepID=A0A914YY21_9BILA